MIGGRSARLFLCLLVSCLVAAVQQRDGAESNDLGASPSAQLQSVVEDSVRAYLQSAGVKDQGIEVAVDPKTDAAGAIVSAQIKVHVATDIEHPEQVAREARLAVLRALVEDGYRTQAPGAPADATLTPEEAAKPVASLTLNVSYPDGPSTWRDRLEVRPVLTFGALVLASLGALALAFVMFVRMVRYLFRRTPVEARKPAAEYKGAAAFPPHEVGLPPLPLAKMEPAVDLAPPPAVLPRLGQEGRLPEMPGNVEKVEAPVDAPARQALLAAFGDMPFEKAVRALAAFDAPTRESILEKLGLHQSVRKRIEQELAELSRT